jgi:hypothetical protein
MGISRVSTTAFDALAIAFGMSCKQITVAEKPGFWTLLSETNRIIIAVPEARSESWEGLVPDNGAVNVFNVTAPFAGPANGSN